MRILGNVGMEGTKFLGVHLEVLGSFTVEAGLEGF